MNRKSKNIKRTSEPSVVQLASMFILIHPIATLRSSIVAPFQINAREHTNAKASEERAVPEALGDVAIHDPFAQEGGLAEPADRTAQKLKIRTSTFKNAKSSVRGTKVQRRSSDSGKAQKRSLQVSPEGCSTSPTGSGIHALLIASASARKAARITPAASNPNSTHSWPETWTLCQLYGPAAHALPRSPSYSRKKNSGVLSVISLRHASSKEYSARRTQGKVSKKERQ